MRRGRHPAFCRHRRRACAPSSLHRRTDCHRARYRPLHEGGMPPYHQALPGGVVMEPGLNARDALLESMRNCNQTARSEEHTSELQSLMRISYAVFSLKKKSTLHHTKWME